MVENTNGGGKQPPRKSFLYYYGLVMLIVMLLNIFLFPSMMDRTQQVRFDQFSDQLKEDNVDEVYVTTNNEIVYTLKNDNKNTAWNVTYKTGEIPGVNLYDLLDGKDVKYSAEINTQASPLLNFLLTWILPLILFVGIGQLMGRSLMKRMGGGPGNAMTFGKSNAKIYAESETGITFADVAGEEEAKDALKEIVDFLHKPEKYSEIGAVLPKGALLVGPPGTGKTLLAKAVAGEAGVPFFSISGSDFVEMFVGVGAARVRDMFENAKKNSPCIIFIDEIDAVGRQRGAGLGGGNDEREQTLNQMLVEMDGFDTNSSVIVIAATNRPDVLDPALLRPGRFDRQVVVPLPDIRGREQILKVHMRKIPVGADVDESVLARGTPGFSGADLANLVNEAALFAARRNGRVVAMEDFERAKDKIMMGAERKAMVMSEDEKRNTAYHESGHALVARLMPKSDPVHKVTIIPRGRALGLTMQLPAEDHYSYDKQYLLSRIAILFGGRIAEEVFMHQMTTGASNDFERATQMARDMVVRYGMSDVMGPMVYGENENEVFLGRSVTQSKHISESTMEKVDAEVRRIIDEQYAIARKLIESHQDEMHKMANALLEWETIDAEQIDDIMNGKDPRPPKQLSKVRRKNEEAAQPAEGEQTAQAAPAEEKTEQAPQTESPEPEAPSEEVKPEDKPKDSDDRPKA